MIRLIYLTENRRVAKMKPDAKRQNQGCHVNLTAFLFLVPASLGLVAVLQAGLNRRIAEVWGIAGATLTNALVLLVLASALYASGYVSGKINLSEFKYWYLFPGALGLALVVGLPLSISKWGALNTFLWLIASQILMSSLLDYWIEGHDFSWKRVIGGLVAIFGAWIAVR